MPLDELVFRRQFLLADSPIDIAGTRLRQTRFGPYQIYRHPDLPLTLSGGEDGTASLALLGYIIDPDRPEARDSDILATLAGAARGPEDLARGLYSLSGRFVLLMLKDDILFVFHDPCGLRTVYYRQGDGHLAIGSSPSILALAGSLSPGARCKAYMASRYVGEKREHWLPTGTSLYEDVQQLIPNHYLRTEDLSQVRYWPDTALLPRQLSEAVDRIGRILRLSIAAAGQRARLTFPLTSGLDSRTLLAAVREQADHIHFYTLRYRDLGAHSPDILIPRRLLGRLGIPHRLVDCRTRATRDFTAVYEGNTSPSHMDDWGKIAYGIWNGLPDGRWAVKGNCSEIGRCYLYPSGQPAPHPDADFFIRHYPGWEELPFLREAVAGWIADAAPAAEAFGFTLQDLFHWEERHGGWQAQSQLEWDIAQEVFTPFNNRELLELMLSVPVRHRIGPEHEIYREIMLRLWPEVLSEPINPLPRKRLAALRKALRPLWHRIRAGRS